MSRITVIDYIRANAEQQALLERIRLEQGKVPNLLALLANSPVALKAVIPSSTVPTRIPARTTMKSST